MKKSRFSDSQILAILKQAEAGTPVPELCREHGMSSATFYKWRAKYGGMDASLMAQKEMWEGKGVRSCLLPMWSQPANLGPWPENGVRSCLLPM
jgi:putative transposase